MRPILLLSLLVACRQDKGETVPDTGEPDSTAGYTASVELSTSQSTAGDAVSYTLLILDSDGAEVEPLRWSLSSSTHRRQEAA